ncbi:MAG: rRNA maturation RNase YbeY, partial [Planctomycetota bacterium]
DATIHQINRQFLDHDYPTDVISFGYECDPPQVSGDVVVSVETAERQAESHGASVAEELLLYVVHGCLHLVGLDDKCDETRKAMRLAEVDVLNQIGVRSPGWQPMRSGQS